MLFSNSTVFVSGALTLIKEKKFDAELDIKLTDDISSQIFC